MTGTVRLHRVIAAPPERVYRAFIDTCGSGASLRRSKIESASLAAPPAGLQGAEAADTARSDDSDGGSLAASEAFRFQVFDAVQGRAEGGFQPARWIVSHGPGDQG
jgi:hypothetical protein